VQAVFRALTVVYEEMPQNANDLSQRLAVLRPHGAEDRFTARSQRLEITLGNLNYIPRLNG